MKVIRGAWTPGTDEGVDVRNAINGQVSSSGLDFADMLAYGRKYGGTGLRRMTIHDRANMLKELAKHLLYHKEEFYSISAMTGATRADGWVDIEGGIGTVFAYSGIARRELPNETFAVEGNVEHLSARGSLYSVNCFYLTITKALATLDARPSFSPDDN